MLLILLSIFGLFVSLVNTFVPHIIPGELGPYFEYMAPSIFALTMLFSLLYIQKLRGVRKSLSMQMKQAIQDNQNYESKVAEASRLNEKISQLDESLKKSEDKVTSMEWDLRASKALGQKLEQNLQSLKSNSGSSEVLTFLSSLQSQGRFLDFLMGDISQYSDDKVGAAARVVHRGCLNTINEFLKIEPVHDAPEGSTVKIDSSSAELDYSFSGAVDDDIPSSGKLVHKGWKTAKLELPKRSMEINPNNMIITPAEVEI